jgi:hypothetical protein
LEITQAAVGSTSRPAPQRGEGEACADFAFFCGNILMFVWHRSRLINPRNLRFNSWLKSQIQKFSKLKSEILVISG